MLSKFFGGKMNLFRGIDDVLSPSRSSDFRLDGSRTALVLAHEHEALEAAGRRGVRELPPEVQSNTRLEAAVVSHWPHPDEEAVFLHIGGKVRRLGDKLAEAGVLAALHPELIGMFRRYLASSAEEKLASVRQALDQLHAAIKVNFSVEDLLVKVGDRRQGMFD